MSSAWKKALLAGACTKIGSGSTPRGGDSVYQTSGVSFIRSQNVYNGVFSVGGLTFLDDGQAEQLKGVTVLEGDVLLNITGDSVARCCTVPVEVLPARVNQHVAIIRPAPDKFDARFLGYFLISPFMQETMLSLAASGGTRKALTKEMIERFEIPQPSLETQKRISGILRGYDDLIDNNRRRMALLEDSARQLYREWFVRLRFPGHEHTPIVDGVPQGWRKVTLTQITSKIGSGATPKGGEAAYQLEGVTLIRSMNVYDDLFDDAGLAFLNDDQAAGLANVVVEPNDILLNITGASVARCCMAPERYLPARVNQHVMIIRVDPKKANPFFVHKAINSDECKRLLLSFARKGSTREALTKEEMANFEITIPTSALMEQFGEIAADAYAQREGLAKQNQKLRQARDLLLSRLMSGEVIV